MVTKKELKTRICDAFNERLSAGGFKFRKWDTTCFRKEDADITYLITLIFLWIEFPGLLWIRYYLCDKF